MLTLLGISPVKAPTRPDRLLKDGDIIDVGDLPFEVLYTPGHMPVESVFQGMA